MGKRYTILQYINLIMVMVLVSDIPMYVLYLHSKRTDIYYTFKMALALLLIFMWICIQKKGMEGGGVNGCESLYRASSYNMQQYTNRTSKMFAGILYVTNTYTYWTWTMFYVLRNQMKINHIVEYLIAHKQNLDMFFTLNICVVFPPFYIYFFFWAI